VFWFKFSRKRKKEIKRWIIIIIDGVEIIIKKVNVAPYNQSLASPHSCAGFSAVEKKMEVILPLIMLKKYRLKL
jgi:hypothetical protein